MKYFRMYDDIDDRWGVGHFEFQNNDNIWTFTQAGAKEALDYMPKALIREKGTKVNITYGDFEILVVDESTKEFFSSNEVLFFPIDIINLPDKSRSYYIMHILHEVECVDLELSKYDLWEVNNPIRPDKAGQFKTIYKLVVDTGRKIEWNIFRIKRYDVAIVVSETLKKNLEKNSITGVKFKEA